MTTDIKGIVIVRMHEDGSQTFHVAGDQIRLFFVDERCPNDRVYEWLNRDGADEIKNILGDSPIGSSQDDRHDAIKHKILSYIDGKPHLSIVEGS